MRVRALVLAAALALAVGLVPSHAEANSLTEFKNCRFRISATQTHVRVGDKITVRVEPKGHRPSYCKWVTSVGFTPANSDATSYVSVSKKGHGHHSYKVNSSSGTHRMYGTGCVVGAGTLARCRVRGFTLHISKNPVTVHGHLYDYNDIGYLYITDSKVMCRGKSIETKVHLQKRTAAGWHNIDWDYAHEDYGMYDLNANGKHHYRVTSDSTWNCARGVSNSFVS